MSGVFMDGGNHDGGHHGISHGIQGDGGHDHGHAMHGHASHGQGIIAHLLGLDHNDHGAHGGHGDGAHHDGGHGHGHNGGHTAQTPFWSSALQGIKLSNIFQGINITPNFLLLLLFGSFTAWLGVIYWIRHNEPLANQVLGSGGAYAPTAVSDRKLLHGMKEVFPVKTSQHTGRIYTPPVGTAAHADALLSAGQAPANHNSAAMNNAIHAGVVPELPLSAAPYAAVPAPAAAAATMPLNAGGGARLCSARLGTHMNAGPGQAAMAPGMNPAMTMPAGFGSGGARLCSARSAGSALGHPAMPAAGGGGARLFSNRSQHAAAQSLPVPQPVGWSLGAGSFSSDTVQFDSQFGVPESTEIAAK